MCLGGYFLLGPWTLRVGMHHAARVSQINCLQAGKSRISQGNSRAGVRELSV